MANVLGSLGTSGATGGGKFHHRTISPLGRDQLRHRQQDRGESPDRTDISHLGLGRAFCGVFLPTPDLPSAQIRNRDRVDALSDRILDRVFDQRLFLAGKVPIVP